MLNVHERNCKSCLLRSTKTNVVMMVMSSDILVRPGSSIGIQDDESEHK